MIKFLLPIFIIIYFIINSFIFIIPEGYCGIILRFGKPLEHKFKPLIYKSGLHIKIPFIDFIKKIDSRIQTTEDKLNNFITLDNKKIIIDYYIKWKIFNFNKYYVLTNGGNISQVEFFLKKYIYNILYKEIKKNKIKNIILNKNNNIINNFLSKKNIKYKYFNNFKKKSYIFKKYIFLKNIKSLGIKIIDFRLKKIYFSDKESKIFYKKMNYRFKSIYKKNIYKGKKEYEKIKNSTYKNIKKILNEVEKKSILIRSKADLKISKIYSYALKKNPELFLFLKIIKVYKKSFLKKRNLIILKSEKNFLNLLN
ncbi:protease modulator HflC [Sodalis-like secondary symbiont of Drepanosiphum platanoidis]|uniref:protease modulator HflC n=1 Tax=Sodalis-like secondary symbiont of Drepanosiphum platanoidis TaxID=2994493 RepID=UPI00346435CB